MFITRHREAVTMTFPAMIIGIFIQGIAELSVVAQLNPERISEAFAGRILTLKNHASLEDAIG